MTKEDLVVFIKSYTTEFAKFFESCNDYHNNVETKLKVANSNEEELKSLRVYMEKSQKQLQALSESNDKSIDLNNELQNKVLDLNNEITKHKTEVSELQNKLEELNKEKEKLMTDIKKKDELIVEYDKKFDEFEEGAQNSQDKSKTTEEKAEKLEKIVEKQKKEIETLRRDNENMALEKITDINEFAQEKIELKKAISISEKNIAHLTREKNSLELKYGLIQRKLDRYNLKCCNKEVQTESSDIGDDKSYTRKDEDTKFTSKFMLKEEELKAAKAYINSLSEELNKVQAKLEKVQNVNSEYERKLQESEILLKQIKEEKELLAKQNQDLNRRREQATSEISKLTEKVNRRSSKGRVAGKTASQAVI